MATGESKLCAVFSLVSLLLIANFSIFQLGLPAFSQITEADDSAAADRKTNS